MSDLIRDLRWWWGDIKLRWHLAMEGEVAVLNVIDAVEGALIHIDEPPIDPVEASIYLKRAVLDLKQLINYEDEPT